MTDFRAQSDGDPLTLLCPAHFRVSSDPGLSSMSCRWVNACGVARLPEIPADESCVTVEKGSFGCAFSFKPAWATAIKLAGRMVQHGNPAERVNPPCWYDTPASFPETVRGGQRNANDSSALIPLNNQRGSGSKRAEFLLLQCGDW
jgi:hypothetical protein